MTDLTTTIEARWVAAGVGLPPAWCTPAGRALHEWTSTDPEWVSVEADVDLTDPQTALGVALRLDAWEIAGGVVWNGFDSVPWVERVAFAVVRGFPATSEAMVARVTAIGMDHHIRRSLKHWDEPAPGTLTTLEPWRKGGWVFTGDRFSAWFTEYEGGGACADTTVITDLAGITDPAEALRVIAESL